MNTQNPNSPKMTLELKAKWIAALRSGEYEQGRATFKAGDAFCCLGVLCAVAGVPPITDGESNWDFVESVIDTETKMLAWHRNDGLPYDDDLNRSEPWTFPQIADWLEQVL